MLKQMLSVMAEGVVRTQGELAAALDVSVPLVSEMITQLVAQGYLAEGTTCVETCEGCALHMACDEDRALQMWTLTEKGRRVGA